MSTPKNDADGAIVVPLLDLRAQYAPLEAEIMGELREICARQQFILGPHVQRLEQEIAAYSQCRFGIGVSSGTDALILALMALGIGPGDEVVTSSYTFFATGGAIARVGARPLFCDIDSVSFNLAPGRVSELLAEIADVRDGVAIDRATGGRIRAMIPVHLYGQCADMDELLEISKRYGLHVIEDAAQAIGAEYSGARRAGSMGDIGCFSFFPSKNLGAFGDAGLCTTNDPVLAERMRILRTHGMHPKYHHSMIGGNFRLDEIQAAVLSVKLGHLDQWTSARQVNAREYDVAFAQARARGVPIDTPAALPGRRHIYNQYVLRVERRDALREYLAQARIGTEVYYPIPLHAQACFAYLGMPPHACPEAMRAAADSVALPIYPELTAAQKRHVIDSVLSFYGS